MADNTENTGSFGKGESALLFPMPSDEDIKKNGIYWYVLSDQEKVFYQMAGKADGLRDAIKLLESQVMFFVYAKPANFPDSFRALSLLERMQKTQRVVFHKQDDTDFEEQLTRVCEKLQIPLELMRDGLKDPPAKA